MSTMAQGSQTNQAIKNSIIVVHGDVLDKIGFHVAEKANRSAELRLEKTLHTLNVMELKGESKHRKERQSLQENLDRLKECQLQLRRQRLKQSVSGAEDSDPGEGQTGTNASQAPSEDRESEEGAGDDVSSSRDHGYSISFKQQISPKDNESTEAARGLDQKGSSGSRSFRALQKQSRVAEGSDPDEDVSKGVEWACSKPKRNVSQKTTPRPLVRGLTQPVFLTRYNKGHLGERPSTANPTGPWPSNSRPVPELVSKSTEERPQTSHNWSKSAHSSINLPEASKTCPISPSNCTVQPSAQNDEVDVTAAIGDWTDVMSHERVVRRRRWQASADWLPPEKEEMLQQLEDERCKIQERVDKFLAKFSK